MFTTDESKLKVCKAHLYLSLNFTVGLKHFLSITKKDLKLYNFFIIYKLFYFVKISISMFIHFRWNFQEKKFIKSDTRNSFESNTFKSMSENYKLHSSPGSSVERNPPANAGDTGSTLGLGRSQMPQRLSLCTTIPKPVL